MEKKLLREINKLGGIGVVKYQEINFLTVSFLNKIFIKKRTQSKI